MRKDDKGRIHFKIVFYGPSLGGKTTALRWLYAKVEGLQKGEFTSIEDETNRTLFFDYAPMSAGGRVLFDVFTVAGQKRHRHQRKVVLQGADGIIFVADSSPDQREENVESFEELKMFLGDALGREIPIVVMLNKRDLPNRMSREEMLDLLGLGGNVPIYETIAIQGVGVKRAFQAISREVILKRLYK